MPLTPQQIEQYRRDGYVFPVSVLEPREIPPLRARLEALEAENGGRFEAQPARQVASACSSGSTT